MMMTRRSFLLSTAAASVAAVTPLRAATARKKIAFIGTEVRRHSHPQHFLDRMALGYLWRGQWQAPRVDIASLYIDQFPEGDSAKSRSQRYHIPIFPTIAEALTLGGKSLAV